MQGAPMLSFENVAFAYPTGKVVFADVNLAAEEGAFVMVRGPSGAGKSTLLRLMNRLEEPTAGTIRFKGAPLGEYDPPLLRRGISYIQQTPVLVDASIRDNLLLPFAFKANKGLARPSDAGLKELLHEFLLDDLNLEDNAANCSVGQSQRLCLARALLLDPQVMLLDEPTSALDPESRRMVEAMTERLNRERGLTMVMISHHEHAPQGARVVEVKGGNARMLDKGDA